MALTSAKNDILRTLSCLPGLFGKICYLAALRNVEGEYEHWGFSRTHGPELASESMHMAHRIIFTEVLRSSLADLSSDLEMLGALQCKRKPELKTQAVPRGTGKGPTLHFNAVVEAVSALVEAQHQSTHRAS